MTSPTPTPDHDTDVSRETPTPDAGVRLRVVCRRARMIGAESYGAGAEYLLPASRAVRYAELGYFTVLDDAGVELSAEEARALAGGLRNKAMLPEETTVIRPARRLRPGVRAGWPLRAGGQVNLDGSPVRADAGAGAGTE